jgi:ribonuclease HI
MSSKNNQVELIFDGGSHGNPGPSYGSFVIRGMPGRTIGPTRLKLKAGTNNEAEYRTLIAGVESILGMAEQTGLELDDIQLLILGDSKLVLNQMQGEWKAKDGRMRALRDEARILIKPFGSVRFQHQPRWRSVQVLGH